MRYRLEAVILAYPFNAAHLRAGASKDGNLSESDGYTLDRIDDDLYIAHPGSEKRKVVPWSNVVESTVSASQPPWSTWEDVDAMLYAKAEQPKPAPQPMGGAFPGQKLDGRTREARALKGAT